MSINSERLHELAGKLNLAVYRGDLLSIALAVEACERALTTATDQYAREQALTQVLQRELEAARADADSWERQNSDRVDDCVKLIAERDALRADLASLRCPNCDNLRLELGALRVEVRRLHDAQAIVDAQALDDGLWFVAHTAPEAYLQAQLRQLHTAIDTARSEK